MGFFDRLKKMLGSESSDADADADTKVAAASPANATAREQRRGRTRPPLGAPPPPTDSLEDALEARDAGDKARARSILQAIDRGAGLRTVLRAAAALEAGDGAEVEELLPKLRAVDAPWRLHLQVAAALGEGAAADRWVEAGAAMDAPIWAVSWARCATSGEEGRRRALVDLLFVDAALARTVAARDLHIEGAHEDPTALARYASLDAGRAAIRRFGSSAVATLMAKIDAPPAAGSRQGPR